MLQAASVATQVSFFEVPEPAYRRAPRQRGVGQPFPDCAFAQSAEDFESADTSVPFARTKGDLVDVAPAMLDRPMVINAILRAFEQRPHALDAENGLFPDGFRDPSAFSCPRACCPPCRRGRSLPSRPRPTTSPTGLRCAYRTRCSRCHADCAHDAQLLRQLHRRDTFA